MDKQEALDQLDKFKDRLISDVSSAYAQRGSDFGRDRFAAWRRQINKFLDENLPGARALLDKKLNHSVYYRGNSESDYEVFRREDGEPCIAFIDSLSLDIKIMSMTSREFLSKQNHHLRTRNLPTTNQIESLLFMAIMKY